MRSRHMSQAMRFVRSRGRRTTALIVRPMTLAFWQHSSLSCVNSSCKLVCVVHIAALAELRTSTGTFGAERTFRPETPSSQEYCVGQARDVLPSRCKPCPRGHSGSAASCCIPTGLRGEFADPTPIARLSLGMCGLGYWLVCGNLLRHQDRLCSAHYVCKALPAGCIGAMSTCMSRLVSRRAHSACLGEPPCPRLAVQQVVVGSPASNVERLRPMMGTILALDGHDIEGTRIRGGTGLKGYIHPFMCKEKLLEFPSDGGPSLLGRFLGGALARAGGRASR